MLKAEGKMTSIYVLGIVTGLLAAILGHLIAFWRLQWKAMESRRTDWEKLRRPVFTEALKYLYDLEKCRFKTIEFGIALGNLKEWFPSKATSIPARGIELLFSVIYSAEEFWIVSQNTNSKMTLTVDKAFMANLVQANKFFISNEDIRWLPEDLKQKKQAKK